ncbi:pyridoxal phosphate-dependent transferase [Chytridium lagenaria]|nr:pyridoxal phosphate-dependent transferase [Chytridium lagenaria]
MSLEAFARLCSDLKQETLAAAGEHHYQQQHRILQCIRENVIGKDAAFSSFMGVRKITYCDYFASGKNLAFVEDFIRSNVMPYYANTHTETSETGSRTTQYREESRHIIKAAIGGSAALGHDKEACVIFTGSGSTQAINKLIHMFGIGLRKKATDEPPRSVCDGSIGDDDPHHQPTLMDKIRNLRIKKPGTRHEIDRPGITVDTVKPVVFLSYQEHHSNILPWRHAEVDIVMIKSVNGSISLDHLECELRCYQSRPLKIGTFSAGSNITGIHADTISLSILLHRYGAYAIFDFAAVGPYINVNMNPTLPENSHLAYMDAAVFSPHKMVGGPGNFVSKDAEVFVGRMEEREEAGTPGILESIRCGLAFFVKELVGSDLIERMERQHTDHIRRKLAQNDRIFVLGGLEDRPRAAVLSFLIVEPKHREQGKPWAYHYNFVAAVLNDFFGIQGRGGCMCAALYTQELLHINDVAFDAYESIVIGGSRDRPSPFQVPPLRTFKPGFTRVSFNYFSAEKEVEFVLDAILWIAKYAPSYYHSTNVIMRRVHGNANSQNHNTLLQPHLHHLNYRCHPPLIPSSALQWSEAETESATNNVSGNVEDEGDDGGTEGS